MNENWQIELKGEPGLHWKNNHQPEKLLQWVDKFHAWLR